MIQVKIQADVNAETKPNMLMTETPPKQKFWFKTRQDSTKDKNTHDSLRRYRKSVWTKEEDDLLKQKVQERGPVHWAEIASFLPNRSGKQCRERWHNHLRDGVTKSHWQMQEYWLLALCVRAFGRKWSAISQFIPGRSDNTIKNQWNCKMKPMKPLFQAKIDKLLKRPESWPSLSQDEQTLLKVISKNILSTPVPPNNKELTIFLQNYCKILDQGLQEYEQLKKELSTTTCNELSEQSSQQEQVAGDLSDAISAGDCVFIESAEENPIMPKCLFH